MDKNHFVGLGKDIDDFEVVNTENAPLGATKQVLWDLWDIGSKFGELTTKGMGFRANDLVLELHDFTHKKGGAKGFLIAHSKGGVMNKGAYFLKLKNHMLVIWDKRLTLEEVKEMIEMIDKIAIAAGDKVREQRIPIPSTEPPIELKMKVEQVFQKKGAIMVVFPDQDINEVLAEFDKQEQLDVIQLGLLKLICLKSEKQTIVNDWKKREKQLWQKGIALEDLGRMSLEEIIRLRKELELN